jgi:GDPmannose 4,6-dehydratase
MKALITGITGQDGSYLAELLLSKGYEVHGIIRRSSSFNTGRIDHIFDKLQLHYGDITDQGGLLRIIERVRPDELYHLAAQSHVQVSFNQPAYTMQVNNMGILYILEALISTGLRYTTKVYNASSSEMFGNQPTPQDENTKMEPVSPYGISKLTAHRTAVGYRERYDMFICNGIMFNHESPRRGGTFLTKKVIDGIKTIKQGENKVIRLGDPRPQRDWGFAPEYVEAMWMMLQQDEPDDYVIATGFLHSVEEFVKEAFAQAGLEFPSEYKRYVHWDCKEYLRPKEIWDLCGNSEKAMNKLGWVHKMGFKELIKIMLEAE